MRRPKHTEWFKRQAIKMQEAFDKCKVHLVVQGLLPILRSTNKRCAAQNVPSESKAKVLKCKDFGAVVSFKRSYALLLNLRQGLEYPFPLQDSAERGGGAFDKCKVHLVVQGQRTKRKGADGVGDYDDAFSLVPAASGFRTF